MAKNVKTFAVIGLGAFGSTVASELFRAGHKVMGVDTDERRVSQMASNLTSSFIFDTTDEAAMREAGLDCCDVALVAIGSDIQASILTTMNLKMLGIDTIWVKASNKTHHRILLKLGADRIIEPEQEMGRHIAQMLNNPMVKDYVSLGNGYSVVTIVVPERLDGKDMKAMVGDEDFNLRPLGLMRGGEFVSCEGAPVTFRKDDRLLLLGRSQDLRRFGEST
ncbi:MAG: TrkA family potassium uptake protein [Proteobacteria bacterium]|nr:TrkA family potassium uptake protein [Pseudomonadota bacterium]